MLLYSKSDLFYPNTLKKFRKVRNKEAKIKSSKDKNNKKGKRIFLKRVTR